MKLYLQIFNLYAVNFCQSSPYCLLWVTKNEGNLKNLTDRLCIINLCIANLECAIIKFKTLFS